MNLSHEKGYENLKNKLWLSMYFAQSFQAVDNVGESGIHLYYNFRFIYLEYLILEDEKIDLGFFHPRSPFIRNF